jgi:hypothetical protein
MVQGQNLCYAINSTGLAQRTELCTYSQLDSHLLFCYLTAKNWYDTIQLFVQRNGAEYRRKKRNNVRAIDFPAIEYNVVLSGYQLGQVAEW